MLPLILTLPALDLSNICLDSGRKRHKWIPVCCLCCWKFARKDACFLGSYDGNLSGACTFALREPFREVWLSVTISEERALTKVKLKGRVMWILALVQLQCLLLHWRLAWWTTSWSGGASGNRNLNNSPGWRRQALLSSQSRQKQTDWSPASGLQSRHQGVKELKAEVIEKMKPK